jgi:hypothetical protein
VDENSDTNLDSTKPERRYQTILEPPLPIGELDTLTEFISNADGSLTDEQLIEGFEGLYIGQQPNMVTSGLSHQNETGGIIAT